MDYLQNAIDTAPNGTWGRVQEPWSAGEVYGVAAQWCDAAAPVYAYGEDGWEPTGMQVADYRHEPTDAMTDQLRQALLASGEEGDEAAELAADATPFQGDEPAE